MRIAANIKFLTALPLTLIMLACEDTIDLPLESAAPVLVVDAWINNKPENQVIILTQSQPYFENANPTGVLGAVVTVTDNNGKVYSFTEDTGKSGHYLWIPQANEVFGNVGENYKLTIALAGETFESTSYMGRVPVIDSITFDSDTQIGTNEKIYQGEFWANEPEGVGDTYWIKAYKNGVLLNRPSEINIAYDAGFSSGGATDGVPFLTPKRRGINPNDTDSNNQPLSPYEPGDSVNVQIYSITVHTFNYLNEVITQTNRPGGFAELFSPPLANVSTNIFNTKATGSKVVGFFNVSAVSTLGKRFTNP